MSSKKKIGLFLLLVMTSLIPYSVNAKTIKDFENEVNNFTKSLEEKEAKIAKNDQEVAEIKKNIASYEKQISDLETSMKSLEEEIDKSNDEIEKKTEESKQLFQYLQVSNGNNAYLEYVFGAESITEMVYRLSVVEQLTEYNQKVMNELDELIKTNRAKTKELAAKQEEFKSIKAKLESEKERINADTQSIRESMPSVQEQLKAAKANLAYYKKLGCGTNEDIYACQYRHDRAQGGSNTGSGGGSIPIPPSVNGFFRPMTSGYVTQNWGGYGGHLGIDLSNSNDRSIPVYPIADGVIFKIYTDSCTTGNWCRYGCNGNAKIVKIRHLVNGRYIYSTYAHLGSYGNISVGMQVTTNTMIGRMGNTGCSTGAHLHLEVTSCDWNVGGGCASYAAYERSTINPRQYIGFPAGLRAWWNGR
jgi:murein DD-endopeptidase MepM/ murein hydrolase activator NlpD